MGITEEHIHRRAVKERKEVTHSAVVTTLAKEWNRVHCSSALRIKSVDVASRSFHFINQNVVLLFRKILKITER